MAQESDQTISSLERRRSQALFASLRTRSPRPHRLLSQPYSLQLEPGTMMHSLFSWLSFPTFMAKLGCLPSFSPYFIVWCGRVGYGRWFGVGSFTLNCPDPPSTALVTQQKDTISFSLGILALRFHLWREKRVDYRFCFAVILVVNIKGLFRE